ncbi:CPBP family intramembrane glutamic endopeptidase [Neobacillus niacini]|uniref:CPBP family intramembrane glutamic endopeptidase n=1 Tax=Neobacillus niacini TaxID=86668 RepID=UPI0021CB7D62|nr:CPBP family intramembrane glutamic endopeptidase [Neobacillus niacini]MCM3763525.1 CPBP family intramembrane metalloprotease [Neobacillus niacini]
MTNNLTSSISKKLLAALLVVTIGAEILLYLTRFSSLASTLYDAVMVASIFVGIKLHRRLWSSVVRPKTKRQLTLQFTGAFLIFFFGSASINIYSSVIYNDFSDDYGEYVEDYTEMQTYEDETAKAPDPEESAVWSFIDRVDTIGSDIYLDAMAGLEEVWRLAYIVLFLVVCKRLFRGRWESGRRDIFVMAALFFTSILFGVDHTLDSEQSWPVRIGAIVTFANMGLLFGLILLWTRNLWLTVLVHSLYDIMATLSWYYIDNAVELFAFGILIVYSILFLLEKIQQKRRVVQVEKVEGAVQIGE